MAKSRSIRKRIHVRRAGCFAQGMELWSIAIAISCHVPPRKTAVIHAGADLPEANRAWSCHTLHYELFVLFVASDRIADPYASLARSLPEMGLHDRRDLPGSLLRLQPAAGAHV